MQFLWIKPTVAGAKEMLASILSAKSMGSKIKASGACTTGYFEVTSLVVD